MAYNYGKMAADSINQFGNSLMQANQMRNQMQVQDEQRQLRQSQQDARVEAARLYQAGDTDGLAMLSIENPHIAESIRGAYKFKNERTKQNFTDSMREILIDPANTDQILTARIDNVIAEGGDPSDTIKEREDYRANPDAFSEKVKNSYALYDPQGYNSLMSTQPQAQKPMSEYQTKQLEGKESDRALRKQEIELRRLESEGKRAKTDEERQLKSEQIKQKKAENEESKAQDRLRIENGIAAAKQNKQTIDDLINNPDYMDSVTGVLNYSKVPETLRTTNQQEASAYLDNIRNSMTIENLSVMSGPLTDKDIQIIASASSRLKEGMSEEALKKELNIIKSAYDRVISNYQKESNRKGYGDQSSGGAEISDDELLGQYL